MQIVTFHIFSKFWNLIIENIKISNCTFFLFLTTLTSHNTLETFAKLHDTAILTFSIPWFRIARFPKFKNLEFWLWDSKVEWTSGSVVRYNRTVRTTVTFVRLWQPGQWRKHILQYNNERKQQGFQNVRSQQKYQLPNLRFQSSCSTIFWAASSASPKLLRFPDTWLGMQFVWALPVF